MRPRIIVCALLLALWQAPIAGVAFASALAGDSHVAQPPGPVVFDIPSQPLVTALEAYSATSGVQLLYDSRLASGRRSTKVHGVLSSDIALQTLLTGTDLAVHYTDSNDVVLEPETTTGGSLRASAPPDGPVFALDTLRVQSPTDTGSRDRLPYRAYDGVIQAALHDALHRNATTRSGDYRVSIKLWIDHAGVVLRSELLDSTGDRERDAAVARVVRGMATHKPPPADMPQPVSVLVAVHSR